MVTLQPFEGASNRTAVMVIQKGKENKYPVPYILWRKEKGKKFTFESSIEEVMESTKRLEYIAKPVDSEDLTSPWLTARPKAIEAIKKILGRSDYKAHAGVYTGGANGVYWVDVILKRPDGLVVVQNITEKAKVKVERVTDTIESDLLYPLLRSKDVQRWRAEPSAWILVPHTLDTGWKAIPEKDMQQLAHRTYAYLIKFKNQLLKRPAYKLLRMGHPFYVLKDINTYTFASWKVVWTRMAKIEAAVIGSLSGKPVVPQETITLVACNTKEEAGYIASLINSTPFQFAAISYSQEGGKSMGSMHLLDYTRIPCFDINNNLHKRLAELSEKAHEAASRGDDQKVREIEAEIDRVAAKIWGLTDEELAEIQKSLQELQGEIYSDQEEEE